MQDTVDPSYKDLCWICSSPSVGFTVPVQTPLGPSTPSHGPAAPFQVSLGPQWCCWCAWLQPHLSDWMTIDSSTHGLTLGHVIISSALPPGLSPGQTLDLQHSLTFRTAFVPISFAPDWIPDWICPPDPGPVEICLSLRARLSLGSP